MTRRRRRRAHHPGLRIGLLAVLLLGVGALVILSGSGDRSVSSGWSSPGGASTRSPARPSPSPAGSPPPAGPARAGTVKPGVRILTADEGGRIRVPVSDAPPARLPSTGPPAGWEMAELVGDASVELVRDEGRLAMRLRSERTSFALHRDVIVDIERYPLLSWSWKVTRLPTGGDVRAPGRDDQAAQVYVVFPRWPSPRTNSDVIGYVWDARAPAGATLSHPRAPNVRIVVLQSGDAHLDTWLREQRNVAADYQALFGRRPPRAGKVVLMIDSNDTRSEAEALFGDLTFGRRGAPQHSEIPTPMLR